MSAIFRDDATAEQKRAAALDRLMAMCPAPYRAITRPYAEKALRNAPDADIDALMSDVTRVEECARNGDMASILAIARRYGASDAQLAQFQAATADPNASSAEQFAGVLPQY